MNTTTPTDTPLAQLVEHVHDWRTSEMQCDAAARVVRNIALTGAQSRNGYRYSEQALREAVLLYENKPVFLDHAANLARPFERSTRDLVGTIVNPRFENGRIRGDVQTLCTEAGSTFLALAESSAAAVGMSHVVLVQRGSDGTVVEKIQEVVSVDAVVFPATNATFSESLRTAAAEARAMDESPAAAAPATLLTDAPGTLGADAGTPGADATRLGLERDAQRLAEELRQVVAERDALREQLDQIALERRQLDRQRRVDELLHESRLPAAAVSDAFRRLLLDAADDAAQRLLVQDRVTLWKRCSEQPPQSRERLATDDATATDTALIRAIKQQPRGVLHFSAP